MWNVDVEQHLAWLQEGGVARTCELLLALEARGEGPSKEIVIPRDPNSKTKKVGTAGVFLEG